MKPKRKPIEVKYQTLVILWLSLLLSQVIFLILIYFSKPEIYQLDAARPLLGENPLIVVAFAVMAILLVILSFVFRNQYLARSVADHDATCVQTGLVLGSALCEGSTILGVILAFAFDYQYFFLWIALGLLGILLHFPRKGTLDATNTEGRT
ncbi:MAG: hypothetical protein LC734_06605 [Acidobacteria bacterium]|nr:hypothetical protein [Acidobacteriota bacterium]